MSSEILQPWPRRKIRYVMFRIQGKTHRKRKDFEPALKALVPAVRELYQKQAAFGGWDGFATSWDIGIDDAFTMKQRQEKWWCFGISRFRAVPNPGLCVIDTGKIVRAVGHEQAGEFFFHQGFAREVEGLKGGTAFEIDYAALVESSRERTAWQRS